jgi:DNA-binding beta-propeller fold protein YncE
VYVSDGSNDRIQKLDLSGAYISEFGTGSIQRPRQLEVHPVTRDVWVIAAETNEVVVFDEFAVEVLRFGGDGSGPGEFQGDPRGIAFNATGTLVFVSDSNNHRVQVFDELGAYQYEFGFAGAALGQFASAGPRGLAVTADGLVLVADEWDFALEEFQLDGTPVRRLFGAPPPDGGVNSPRGLALDASGRLYVNDWWNQRIVRVESDGTGHLPFGFRGTKQEDGSFNFAWDVAIQTGTGRVFVANRESNEITVFESDGTFVARWGRGGTGPGDLMSPQGLAFDPTSGNLVVADAGNNRMQVFAVAADGMGTFVAEYGSVGSPDDGPGFFNTPTGVAVGADGTIWVADTRNHSIQSRDPTTGNWTRITQSGDAGSFNEPWGVVLDAGNDVWVADSGNNRILEMTENGTLYWFADGVALGAGPFDSEFGIAIDGTRVWVSDTFNNRVVELQLS